MAIASTIISAGAAIYGAASQGDAARKSGNLADAQARQVAQQMELAKDAYETMTKPQFEKASNLLWGYASVWTRSVVEKVIKCGTATCAYVRDDGIYNRIAASTSNIVNKARRSSLRGLNRSQVGAAYDNDFRLSALQSSLMVKAIGVAEAFESEKEFKWTTFYWQRAAACAALAQNTFASAANLMVGAASNLQSGINGLSNIEGLGIQAAGLRMQGLDRQSEFAGGFGSIAGFLGAKGGSILDQLSKLTGGSGSTAGSTADNAGAIFDPPVNTFE